MIEESLYKTSAPHLTSHRAERTGRRYLLWCLLPFLLGYLFPFVAERVAPLNGLAAGFYGNLLDHGYGLDGDNADIVIFGDSTAIFGVDTERLSQQLGLKVTNIPGTGGSAHYRRSYPAALSRRQPPAPAHRLLLHALEHEFRPPGISPALRRQ